MKMLLEGWKEVRWKPSCETKPKFFIGKGEEIPCHEARLMLLDWKRRQKKNCDLKTGRSSLLKLNCDLKDERNIVARKGIL